MPNKEFLEACESDINNIFKRNGMIKVSTIFDILGVYYNNYDNLANEYCFVDDGANGWTLKHVSEISFERRLYICNMEKCLKL